MITERGQVRSNPNGTLKNVLKRLSLLGFGRNMIDNPTCGVPTLVDDTVCSFPNGLFESLLSDAPTLDLAQIVFDTS